MVIQITVNTKFCVLKLTFQILTNCSTLGEKLPLNVNLEESESGKVKISPSVGNLF